ncbi:translocated intimin receptor Tir [Acidobacteria bacterium AB60]|nr:translocated intimin receptor Tir [Acidobacteria bacterium AB60]
MKSTSRLMCVLSDSHFLIPLGVFVLGVALLIAMH